MSSILNLAISRTSCGTTVITFAIKRFYVIAMTLGLVISSFTSKEARFYIAKSINTRPAEKLNIPAPTGMFYKNISQNRILRLTQ